MRLFSKIKVATSAPSQIPTTKAIQQSRATQSQLDRVEHEKHLKRQQERNEQRTEQLLRVGKSHSIGSNVSSFVSDIDYGTRFPETKTMKAKPIEEMTMSELANANIGFFGVAETIKTDTSFQGSVSKPDSTAFVPLKDVVYNFIQKDGQMNNSYWLKWESKMQGVLYCSYQDLNIRKLILSASTRGLPFIHEIEEISFGRFSDI
jgi:hypothetical protein